jgi:pyruvate carboxylase
MVALKGTSRDTGFDLHKLLELGEYFESIVPKYRDYLDTTKFSVIDPGVLWHQIPGGMFTNMVAQLREAGALDRINEVYAELPQTRKELGYPPLVTPTSQIIGTQAIQNVLFGRYKMFSAQVRDYCYGLYGTPPAPIDPEIQKKILKGYSRGETPITCRPADILEPELEKAKEATRGIAKDIGDVLVYALYPVTGMEFLKWKYGLEKPPESVKPKTLEDIKREDELVAKAKAGKLVEKPDGKAPAKGAAARSFNVYINEEYYKVEVEPEDGTVISVAPEKRQAVAPAPEVKTASASAPVAAEKKQETKSAAAPEVKIAAGETAIMAPIPGTVLRCSVQAGDKINAGDEVLVMEAMKMENQITAPVDGKIKVLYVKPGDKVASDAVLAIIV